jgi:lipoic acid synthetase
MPELKVHDLGKCSYDEALALQERLAAAVRADEAEQAHVVLVEHDPPVITLGRGADESNVLARPKELAARGVQVRRASRGGDVTWHGPGQLVAYPIIRLDLHGRDVHAYLRLLEEAIIRALAKLGVQAARCEGKTGAWVGLDKIAAVGVSVSRWVTSHGLSINVGADLRQFGLIVPCGIVGRGVTSVSRVLGREVEVGEVKGLLVGALAELLGLTGTGAAVCRNVNTGDRRLSGKKRRLGASPLGSPLVRPPGLPSWLTTRLAAGGQAAGVTSTLHDLRLATVCDEAHCPNRHDCFSAGVATFLILGPSCTRTCRFCAVTKAPPSPPDADEPARVAQAAARLKLKHVVVSSVTRDDLPDGGAEHFAATIAAVRAALPGAGVEVLVPDFGGRGVSLDVVLRARPDVLNHNVETVERLYPAVRPAASYRRSLELLALARAGGRQDMLIKSGIMLGLGESAHEIRRTLRDLRRAGCDIVTLGQYLAPSPGHVPVARYVEPAEFERWRAEGLAMGFKAVASGPLVRSSYRAGATTDLARGKRTGEGSVKGRRRVN